VATSIGLPLAGIAPLPEVLPDGAIVVLVGVSGRVDDAARRAFDAASATVVDWLRRVVAPAGGRLLCICSGALIAARAGLLDGRECTTHYALCDDLRRAAPRARVLENRLYVTDGGVSTSAGITAGIDLMLSVVASLAGPRAACAVARNMVVYMRRSGTDPQLSAWVSGRNHLHPALHRVQDALAADPVRAWSLAQMADVACTSTRHLARLFHDHAGVSPLDYLHQLRVAVARELIAQSSLDMEAVAARAGFGSARHLRRVWHKYEAQAPSGSRSPA
jgi:transcriptional regulator GlxA family with amidase domain